jgi:tetratricopeptide (TPR) repeat protein
MKLRPEIEEKLRLDELLNKDSLEDKNPDWEQFFNDTPDVYKKLEEFSMMQMDGSDVFMGAFSMLKRFGFFDGVSNWFLPFYKNHPEILKSVSGVSGSTNWNAFFESIEQAPVMCNSDKYSFTLNLGFMPEMQKTMMLELFTAELNQMKEIAEEENKNNSTAVDKTIFAQYIQDLYRFFKLHPQRKNFSDIFRIRLNVHNSYFLNQVLNTKKLRQIGEFYFGKNYYQQALDIFSLLYKEHQSYELLEKIGFCYQKLNQFQWAIEFYKKAEIYDTKRIWLQKKLGYCYHKTMQFDKAIEYYKKVENSEPENMEVQAYLGQLFIDMEDFETALKYYFKVEYLKPHLIKVQRPIAWCSFLLKKPDQALRYFKKVVDAEGKRTDYLNLGHCYWVIGKLTEAIESYRIALKLSGSDTRWFINSMTKDVPYLESYGIENLDVVLMADYITVDL